MNTESPQPSSIARPRRRPWRWLVALLLFVVVLVAGSAGFLLGTETGLHAAYRLAHRLVPDLLTIGRLEGSLLGGPVMEDIDLDLPVAHVRMGRLALDWRPARLLQGELHVVALEARETRILLRQTDTEPAPQELPDIELPLRLIVERLQLTDLAVTPAGAEDAVAIETVRLAAEWNRADLAINTFDVVAKQPAGEAKLSGNLSLAGDYPLGAAVQWQFALADDLPLQGEGRVDGDVRRLVVSHRTDGALRSEFEGELSDLLGAPAWRGRLDVRDLSPRALVPDAPPGLLAGRFEGEGTLEKFSLDGALEADPEDYRALGRVHAQVQAELAENVLRVTKLALGTSETEMSVQASGIYRIAGSDPGAFEARAEWHELGWPLDGAPQYRVPRGTLQASGTVDDFAHEVTASLEGTDLPPADVKWQGRGNPQSLTFDSLRVDTLDGRVEGAGKVTWLPGVTWSLDLAATDLQPSAQWPEFSGRLGARVATTGSLDGKLEARLALEELSGELQQRPVAGHGSVQWRNDILTVDDLELSAGPNRLALSGTVGEALALDADFDAPDLSVLLPDAAGQLRLGGRVTGRIERPQLDGELAARALRFGDIGLETADGRLHVAADRGGVLDIDLRAAGLQAGGLAWDDVAVVANGTPSAHRFSLVLDGKPLALRAEGDASWGEDGSYAGNLQTLALESAETGGWRLERPAAFAVRQDAWELQRLCLGSTQNLGGGCVAADGSGGSRWNLDAEIPRLDLGAFAVLVPEGTLVEGELRASARMAAEDNRLSGEARVEVPSGTSRVDLEEQDQVLDFSGTTASVKATSGELAVDIDLPLAGLGRVQGKASLPGWRLDAPARAEQAVRATLKGRIPDLAPLNAVIPQVTELRGSVDADLDLTGTLGNARVNGAIRIADTAFEVPAAGVRVGELSLVARSRTLDVLEYAGSARIGDGQIDLSGETRLTRDLGAVTRVTIKGEKLTVVDVPQATVAVSPDLTFSLDRELAKLTGEVVVPEARLRPRGIPAGSVSPSDDVVIKGETDEGDNLKLLTAADVRLKLGDRVSFEGFGLRGLFRGDLRITQEPGRLALGNGQLTIEDGTFATFGEELTIEQGRLVFANTPVYNPGINIVAAREYPDAKVGARAAGTLKKPQVTFFSDPPMGQAEALNYLLTGGGSSRGSATSGATVVGGNLLVKEVGRQIGLDDVGVTRQDDSDELSLYVGTYLTPQLYMQYVSEMGDRANRIRVRYDLTKRIQVEAETGDVQSMDVFYTIER